MEKFVQDIAVITEKLCRDEGVHVSEELNSLRKKLVILSRKSIVKINLSVMELVCAKHLIKKGYDVDIEKQVSDILVCDLFVKKGESTEVVEIETGFVPPDHALDPAQSSTARIASKIARYSQFAEKFSLGTPPTAYFLFPIYFRSCHALGTKVILGNSKNCLTSIICRQQLAWNRLAMQGCR